MSQKDHTISILNKYLSIEPLQPLIYAVNKPKGFSSYTIVDIFAKALKVKAGHAGTLDPLAHGRLIILTDYATKLTSHYLKQPKTYNITIIVGITSTTFDLEGTLIVKNAKRPTTNLVKHMKFALENLKGPQKYLVPIRSAVKYKGEPLYRIKTPQKIYKEMHLIEFNFHKASTIGLTALKSELTHILSHVENTEQQYTRLVEKLKVPPRPKQNTLFQNLKEALSVNIRYLETISPDLNFLKVYLTFRVTSGTYVRSIIHKLQELIAYPLLIIDIERV